LEIGVTESNGDGRILMESSQLAVCAHAQCIFGQKAQIDWLAINVNDFSFLPAAPPACLEHKASSLRKT